MKKMRWALGTIGVVIIVSVFLSVRTSGSFTGSPVSSDACTELVSDGGFEAGGRGWSQYSKLGFQLVSSFYRHSGQLGAWLGAANNAYDRLAQPLVLPTQADSITLSLWWALATEEGPGGAFDFLQVGLYAPDGTTKIASLLDVNNDSAVQWVWNLLNADLTAYAGQSLQLRIEATTDDNSPTSFFVDDVSVLSCVAATATATPTVTATATATSTVTATATATSTVTATATATLTGTATATATLTRLSPTSTPSITTTLTRTATPVTPAPSVTPTVTSTATQTPTLTSTPQSQVTSTPTKTHMPGVMDRRVYLPVLLRMP